MLFETGQYEELLNNGEALFDQIPSDKKEIAHLFLGRSYLALKKYELAAAKLEQFILSASSNESKSLQPALLSLIEASFQSNNLKGIDLALSKLYELNPAHPEIPKGYFSRALLFKKL